MTNRLFVASTGQNVGKTTVCLGLFAGLQKRFSSVGFMKPVGQEHVEAEPGVFVDKDVLLFKKHFALSDPYAEMSPVLFPKGFTRRFLDGEIERQRLSERIREGFGEICSRHPFTLVEGTGHMGVGSLMNLNNAEVAAQLKLPVVLVTPGGLGSAFDEFSLNLALCQKHGANIVGVILNRVQEEKRKMVLEYMPKALAPLKIPLLGCIPFDPLLSNFSMQDFEQLFHTHLLSGAEHRLRHFTQIRLVTASTEASQNLIASNQLIITPVQREDLILAMLTEYRELKKKEPQGNFQPGLILTGDFPPRAQILNELRKADIPALFASVHSYTAMKMIASYTAKILNEDVEKVKEAIAVVEQHIDFEKLLQAIG